MLASAASTGNYLFIAVACVEFRKSFRSVHRSVPFVQHPSGNQHSGLWEGAFFIACQFPWAKVTARRRGASPSRPVWDPAFVLGFWVVRGEIRGPSRGAAPARPNPPTG